MSLVSFIDLGYVLRLPRTPDTSIADLQWAAGHRLRPAELFNNNVNRGKKSPALGKTRDDKNE